MVLTLATRKSIVTIEADDLDVFGVWEFCLDEEGEDGMDETWVRPLDVVHIPRNASALTVAAHLLTRSGEKLAGFIAVDTEEGVQVSGVGVPHPRYQFLSTTATAAERQQFAAALGAIPSEVFPLTYHARLVVAGENGPPRGTIA